MIDQPILIMGPGRSGTTLLYNALSLHRHLGYWSSWSVRSGSRALALLSDRARVARLEPWALERIKGYPQPAEAYQLWRQAFPGYHEACQHAVDDPPAERRLRASIEWTLASQRRRRFITKVTGPSNGTFFRSMFPDAKLVWIDRDPRAVAYSYVKQQWSKAAAGDTRPEQLQTAANHYLACWHSIEFEPEPLFRLTLERFVSNPSRHMHEILNACDLPSDRKIDAALRRWAIDVRTGWRTALDEQEKGLLQDLLAEPISAGRYD